MTPPNLTIGEGPILDALDGPDKALVVPVNCIAGVMGAGLALAAADRWRHLREVHYSACNFGFLRPGVAYWVYLMSGEDRPLGSLVLAATKNYWRAPSRREFIEGCLDEIVGEIGRQSGYAPESRSSTILCPALGCGLGGLEWSEVEPLIRAAASRTPDVEWRVWGPGRGRKL